MNPPVRSAEHREGLWRALAEGIFDVFGSDHAPHTLEEKSKPYPGSPSGMPGVQTLLPVLLTFVAQGRLRLEDVVRMACENPAALYGIQASYVDIANRRQDASAETLLATLQALGAPIERAAAARDVLRERIAMLAADGMEPVTVAWAGRLGAVPLRIGTGSATIARYTIRLENGEVRTGEATLQPVRGREPGDSATDDEHRAARGAAAGHGHAGTAFQGHEAGSGCAALKKAAACQPGLLHSADDLVQRTFVVKGLLGSSE
jgi:hypothetical protein